MRTKQKILWLILPLIAAWVSLLFANLDAREARHVLFMDEAIFFDNTEAILKSVTPSEFWTAWLLGPEHRYGQIGFMVCAFTGFLPYTIAGDSGLILAIRLTCTTALLCAYGLFGWSLLRLRTASVLPALALILLCIGLHSTVYYAIMPKPEPFQLLLLAGYVAGCVHFRSFIGWHAIFLGAVFGAKISGLPIVIGMLGVAACHHFASASSPFLDRMHRFCAAVCWVAAGAIICEPAMVLDTRHYLTWTFKMTTHGSDSPSNGLIAWLGLMVGDALPLADGWLAIASGLAVALIVLGLSSRLRQGLSHTISDFSGMLGIGLLCCGCGSLLLVMGTVHRLWEFYLHPGLVMTLCGGLLLAGATTAGRKPHWDRWLKPLATVTLILLTVMWTSNGIRHNLKQADGLAMRSAQPEYAKKHQEYQALVAITKALSDEVGRPLVVIIDPEYWDVGTQPWMTRWQAWGPDWDDSGDMKIMNELRNPAITPTPANSSYLATLTTTGADPFRVWSHPLIPEGMLVLVRRSLTKAQNHSVP